MASNSRSRCRLSGSCRAWRSAPPSRLADYLAWVAEDARTLDGVELAIRGDTDEELATTFVAEMVRGKLARIDAR